MFVFVYVCMSLQLSVESIFGEEGIKVHLEMGGGRSLIYFYSMRFCLLLHHHQLDTDLQRDTHQPTKRTTYRSCYFRRRPGMNKWWAENGAGCGWAWTGLVGDKSHERW